MIQIHNRIYAMHYKIHSFIHTHTQTLCFLFIVVIVMIKSHETNDDSHDDFHFRHSFLFSYFSCNAKNFGLSGRIRDCFHSKWLENLLHFYFVLYNEAGKISKKFGRAKTTHHLHI